MVVFLRDAAKREEIDRVTQSGAIDQLLDTLMAQQWAVYTKKGCLDQSGTVVDYLVRYTHRIALTNARLLKMDDEKVTFRVKKYRHGNGHKTLTLNGETFAEWFLLHVLPKSLMRIRHCGLLANCCRGNNLAGIRRALAKPPPESGSETIEVATPG